MWHASSLSLSLFPLRAGVAESSKALSDFVFSRVARGRGPIGGGIETKQQQQQTQLSNENLLHPPAKGEEREVKVECLPRAGKTRPTPTPTPTSTHIKTTINFINFN